MLTQAYLKECLDYDPETGLFTWKVRPRYHFAREMDWKTWNTKFSGKTTGARAVRGYLDIGINSRNQKAHRIAFIHMTGACPAVIDHKNGDPTDNRWANLRAATQGENVRNTRMAVTNTSGIKGVCWDKSRGKWKVAVQHKGKTLNMGRFDDLELAELVAHEARAKYHGEFANHG